MVITRQMPQPWLKALATAASMTPFGLFALLLFNTNLYYGSALNNFEDKFRICKDKLCVPKCCPYGKYVHKRKSCKEYPYRNYTLDFSEMPVYDENKKYIVSNVNQSMILIPAKFDNKTFQEEAADVARVPTFNLFLTKEGIFYVETPNAYLRWQIFDRSVFCIDYQILFKKLYEKPVPRVWVYDTEDEEYSKANIYLTSAILISCFFLLLVMIVYVMLAELRNLCGLILMAYVFSLFWAFLLLAVIQIKVHATHICIGLTFSIYYFFLATFCWMNVMSYDIWWTFRGYAKARPIHRRGEHFKFLMYCLYAFGLPLAMTIGLYIMNSLNLRHMPYIITPMIGQRGCFIEGGEKLVYLYLPMLILILSNWIFYLMTAFNVWRLSRGTAVLDSAAAGNPAAHRTHWNRFMVYLKLFVVMGLNWVFEVLSFLSPDFRVWNITDAYNILIGLAIFLIFVCKKKILRKLKKRFGIIINRKLGKWEPSNRSVSSSTSECTSQETTLPLVCVNPKGPEFQVKI